MTVGAFESAFDGDVDVVIGFDLDGQYIDIGNAEQELHHTLHFFHDKLPRRV